MGQYDEEALEEHERVWLEAHPNIKRKLELLDDLLMLCTKAADFAHLRNWVQKYLKGCK